MIQLKNITKTYGAGKNTVNALKGVTIDFPDKGLVVILGKSGCGKSTLLNIMGGLDKPSGGELIVNGRSASRFTARQYDSYRNTYVGMVFQEFNLIDEITVYQNIEITLKLQEKNTDVNSVDEVLKTVGLSNLGYRKPSELSGGQRQRVSLARALLKKPQILLADEPTGALDAATGEDVFEVLKKLATTQLVVVVTHDRELAFTYGERIIEIVDGEIVSDKQKQMEGFSPIKSLSKNVIEVAAGGVIAPDDINKKLKKGSHNYVGISHDKDRISLAYPETFDSFYLPPEKIKMKDTEEVPSDNREFKLQKNALRFKDMLKMAKVNRKRTKKRFRFIAILNMLCFSMFALSIIMSGVNLPNVIAKSAFDDYSQSAIGVTLVKDIYYWQQVQTDLNAKQVKHISDGLGAKKSCKNYTTNIFPYYAINPSTESADNILSMVAGAANPMDLSLNCYTGVIEGDKLSDIGLKNIKNGGADECLSYDEIIISDFAADKLLQRGFFGKDKDGVYGTYFPEKITDLVGMQVNLISLSKDVKIAGIFETDYSRYSHLHSTENRLSSDSQIEVVNWQNNKDFLYSKIFTKKDFVATVVGSGEETTGMWFANNGLYGGNENQTFVSFDFDEVTYSKSVFDYPKDKTKASFLWVSPSYSVERTNLDFSPQMYPDISTEYNYSNSMVVSTKLLERLYPEFENAQELIDLLESDKGYENSLYLQVGSGKGYTRFFSISAIYDEDNFNGASSFAVSSYSISELKYEVQNNKTVRLESLLFDRGTRLKDVQNLAANFLEDDYLIYSSVGSVNELLEIGDMFDTVAKVFLYIALGVAAFSFLMMLNYMSSSVRFRAKEIAVYRVVGASRMDIAKIFLTEGMMLVIVSTILSCILTWLFTVFLTISFKATLQIFNLSFSIISFNLATVGIVFLAITVLVLVSLLIPVISITSKKAIDALKIIG